MSHEKDRSLLRELAERYAAIAALPVQEEKRRLWRKLNALKPERPMVLIDQVCWNEIRAEETLILRCENAECRVYERVLRRALYQWAHFPADMVVEPFIRVDKAVANSGFGLAVKERTIRLSEFSDVSSHQFVNLIHSMEDIQKIQTPVITHDPVETQRRMGFAGWLFGGILEIREEGVDPYLSIWDPISMWMSVEGLLYAMVDSPDLMHALAKRVLDGYMCMLDQLEAQGLLCHHQSLIHCTGAYTDDLPAAGFEPRHPRTEDIWMMGLAQAFATVSPSMFEEYELTYSMPLFNRFGLVYYGCCDPLDGKMSQVRRIPHLRKISMSPWVNQARGAREIGPDYVFSRKPNPSYLAMDTFDDVIVKKEFRETLEVCRANGCPVEFILKDISTIRSQPERLSRWADIAMRSVTS